MLIPWIGGIDVSSVLGLDCMSNFPPPLSLTFPFFGLWGGGVKVCVNWLMVVMVGIGTGMQDDTPNDQCKHQVMCCDGQPNVCLSLLCPFMGEEVWFVILICQCQCPTV